jgi:hypothetical protein
MSNMTQTNKTIFLAYVPFTGLGLYGGFRGNRWLKNRIQIFKQFVVSSLRQQTDQDFVLWVGWRAEERTNPLVSELGKWLRDFYGNKFVFTFGGLCFWDDKYEDKVAWDRLALNLHNTMPDLFETVADFDEVIMLIQPSDDLYEKHTVRRIKDTLASDKTLQAVTYGLGYHINYLTKELRDYNPATNPPFFAYRMPRQVFTDPLKHMEYTGPYKSHEYIGDKMKLWRLPGQGFMVGSHTENISTHFNHPFTGRFPYSASVADKIFSDFGILGVPPLTLPPSWRKDLLRRLPHNWQKKLRYVVGERVVNRIYQTLRN